MYSSDNMFFVPLSSILDNLVAPLQEKLEDWKKAVATIDKDHTKGNTCHTFNAHRLLREFTFGTNFCQIQWDKSGAF